MPTLTGLPSHPVRAGENMWVMNPVAFFGLFLPALTGLVTTVVAQASAPSPALPQLDTFNATPGRPWFAQAQAVIQDSGVDNVTAQAVQTAIDFERSNWAGYSIQEDSFYSLPPNASSAAPGQVLSVQENTNNSLYTIAPDISISRFLYQTETFNGSAVPASAYVLWPWLPRKFRNSSIEGIPVVVWAHGTSGMTSECAPSHIKNLWYQYSAPYILALQGYAVVGIDYAGLGPNQTASGEPVVHQYECNPAGANDLFYAVQAAQEAWPSELTKEFVVFGHSEGGGYAWAAAQRQAVQPVEGYLGAIAGSPITDFASILTNPPSNIVYLLLTWSQTMLSLFGSAFNINDWVTPAGLQARQLYLDLSGCQSVSAELFSPKSLIQPTWNQTWYLSVFDSLARSGNKPFAGPLMVMQGLADTNVSPQRVMSAVNATCDNFAQDRSLEFATFEGVTHVPVLYAGQQVWLSWIADRFEGVELPKGCKRDEYQPPRPTGSYKANIEFFLEDALYSYEVA